jgi:glycosyltransferase involved in cell wall biosynthesis
MRILFAHPGLHWISRGAETAFIALATELCSTGNKVTLIGSGQTSSTVPYRFIHAGCLSREKFESFPFVPGLRDAGAYEDLSFIPALLQRYKPAEYDVTLTCSYPFINWALRRPTWRSRRPPHIFITQNGDWAPFANNSEYRFFGCEGLVCTNPDYYERNRSRWNCRLIPNGIDCDRFRPGPAEREAFGLPANRPIVLMVSALIPSKRVDAGIEVVANLPGWHLVVAGDGPDRRAIDAAAAARLGDRFTRLSIPPERMPALYRSVDVVLHLSTDEAYGNVFAEAMACGTPVVAHESVRTRWIVGDVGFLADTSNFAGVTQQIELAKQVSPARRQAGVERAANNSWRRVAQMYEEFLHQIVDRANVPGFQEKLKRIPPRS